MSSPKGEKNQLLADIRNSVDEFVKENAIDKVKCLSRYNPEKVANILYLYSIGNSQTALVKKYGFHRKTVINVLIDYADHLGKFKELGGKLAARSYIGLESLEEDLIDALRARLESGYTPEFKDLKEISIAKSNSQRHAMTARGEASQITEERKVITQEDYEDTLKAAKERLQALKKADIIDIDGDN
jgi:hypothetical protein